MCACMSLINVRHFDVNTYVEKLPLGVGNLIRASLKQISFHTICAGIVKMNHQNDILYSLDYVPSNPN